jgi:hypothetical protein
MWEKIGPEPETNNKVRDCAGLPAPFCMHLRRCSLNRHAIGATSYKMLREENQNVVAKNNNNNFFI